MLTATCLISSVCVYGGVGEAFFSLFFFTSDWWKDGGGVGVYLCENMYRGGWNGSVCDS